MSADTIWIEPDPPATPSIQPGVRRIPIHDISKWSLGPIPSVLAFPCALDEARLVRAITKAAAYWPTICGRYVREARVNESGFDYFIPFSTQRVDRALAFDNCDVVQSTLEPFRAPLDRAHLFANADVPLFAVRLSTLRDGSSVLSVTWAHLLGDAASAHLFLTHLAQLYHDPAAVIADLPVFQPHASLPPSTPEIQQRFKLHQLKLWTLPAATQLYTEETAQSETVVWRLSPSDVAGMRADALIQPGEILSTQDLISGWWTGLVIRAGHEIARVVYTISWRTLHKHPAFPPHLKTLAGNVAQMRAVPVIDRHPAGIARGIRKALDALRTSPDMTLVWLANAAGTVAAAADANGVQCVLPLPDEVVVNSNLRWIYKLGLLLTGRYEWAIAFDGVVPDYYTAFSARQFLRVYQANGTLRNQPELIFAVNKGGERSVFELLLAEDRARWQRGGSGVNTVSM